MTGTVFVLLWVILFGLFSEAISDDFKQRDDGEVPTTTIMDVLSANDTFSKFIMSLQRSGLVDYVNELENVTFLAPTNDAFDGLLKFNTSLLSRFIVDKPVFSYNLKGVSIYSTLNTHGSPFVKHLAIPILFDREPDGFCIENSDVVWPDRLAPASNSVVHGVNALPIDMKRTVCDFFADPPIPDEEYDVHASLFATLFNTNNYCNSKKISNVTFILPSDAFLYTLFDDVEFAYLQNERGERDRNTILENFILEGMYGGNIGNESIEVRSLDGNTVDLSSKLLGNIMVIGGNFSRSSGANYLLSDAVVHYFGGQRVVPDINVPTFTPREYLIGLNQTHFVDEIDFRKLSHLIDDDMVEQTLFVSDDDDDANDLSFTASASAKNGILYKFVNGTVDLDSNQLVDSKFCSQSSLGHCQKLKITHSADGTSVVNDHSVILPEKYTIGNTTIYFVDDDVVPPSKLEHSLSPDNDCTKSLQWLSKFDLLKFKPNGGLGYTVFLPSSDSWMELDLTLDYLANNPDKLELVLGNLILNGLVYGDFIGETQLHNINGDPIVLSKGRGSAGITVNSQVELPFSFESQILFKDGVVYPADKVVLPETMNIGIEELIQTVQAKEFMSILDVTNLTNLVYDPGYSFLVPSSTTLQLANITSITRGPEFLVEFAKLHVLPGESMRKLIDCEPEIPTLLDGVHLTCRRLGSGGLTIGILEGNDHEVRVIRKGFTTTNSGILLVDKPINPDWLDSHNPPIRLRLPVASVLIGMILGMIILTSIVACCFALNVGSTKETIDEEIGGGAEPDEDARLLNEEAAGSNGALQPQYGAAESAAPNVIASNGRAPVIARPKSFSQRYSEHSTSKPMDFPSIRN